MKQGFRVLLCAVMILALAAGAAVAEPKFKASKSSVSFEESPTDEMVAQAVKAFAEAGGDAAKFSLSLRKMDDAGLQKICKAFPGASTLFLGASEVSSLAPLATLTGLKELKLQELPNVTDISPLASLKEVWKLVMGKLPQMKDISPLAGNSKIKQLEIASVPYAQPDLAWLAPMTELSEITLEAMPKTLKSLAGIEDKARLRIVRLKSSLLPDLTPLTTLQSMTELNLAYSDGELSGLKGCKKLEKLSLYGAKFRDLAPLAEVTTLKELTIYAMKNADAFDALGTIKSLETVHAGLTPMTSVAWAAELPNLKEISFFTEALADLSPIGHATNLRTLKFWKMNLPDLGFLAALSNLENLKLDEVNAKAAPLDLKPVGALPNLTRLDMPKSNVTNIEALASAPKLKDISISKGAFSEEQVKVLTDAGKNVKQ